MHSCITSLFTREVGTFGFALGTSSATRNTVKKSNSPRDVQIQCGRNKTKFVSTNAHTQVTQSDLPYNSVAFVLKM